MSNNDVFYKVRKVISDQLNIDQDKITKVQTFDSLGADSLDQIEILMNVEELFNIEISDEQSDKIFCIQDLVACVESNIN
jgi:acyl carrier protein